MPPGWQADGDTFNGADVPHGHASNVDWDFLTPNPQSIDMICAYPDTHPIKALHRSVRPDPETCALDITLTVEARRPCRLPIGLHPTFRLPKDTKVELVAPAFRQGRVFPAAHRQNGPSLGNTAELPFLGNRP